MATNSGKDSSFSESSFGPLRHQVFAVLWAATVIGNIGTFMRDVTSSWLMTELASSPMAVAGLQAASTLPIFLLAIPAGVLSDILDRRRFLLFIQVLLMAVSLCLLALSAFSLQSVVSLIALTFVGGVGGALMAPTWQAIVPELVPKSDLRNAVALNSLGINISRSIGPALGGFVLAYLGATVSYGVDIVTYLLTAAALIWWKRAAPESNDLRESFSGAFRAGLRYAKASPELHVVLLRAAVYFAFTSAIWALLPLVARTLLGGDAGFYGVLLGAVGLGAILGALVMPVLRKRLDADGMMLLSAVIAACVMALLALSPPQWLGIFLSLAMGAAWIAALTTLNATAQTILPNWVRGRSLAVYLTTFNGAMTFGSIAWGTIAETLELQATLLIASIGLVLTGFIFHRMKLPNGDTDLSPSDHWPEPLIATSVEGDRGPVLILVEYEIDPVDRRAFHNAASRLSGERRRDGAYAWGISEDVANPMRIIEWFLVESWSEHLRQHHRVSKASADLQVAVTAFHRGGNPPLVKHLLALAAPDATPSKEVPNG
ncbi:MFS transporter [Rhizobium sp. LCM 4573]|uniref:MFS transporter n=1 Tax=Rhizobium sp. LCM 4573 TaxID=1848291 RepID=UPI0008DA8717|nr:MFS transporter [Rhizobium sp. LCM 4573]OHV78677.1 MFS transporter [Rhizobium sp. LCM 4573]